jgi:hypothetical protein
MARTISKQRIIGNPARRAFGSGAGSRYKTRRSGAAHKPSKRSNPGQILGFTLGNPGRKATKMATTQKKHHKTHKPKGSGVKHNYKRNPGHKAVHHHRRRHNPSTAIGPLVNTAVFAIVGALGSKLGAQMVLGTNNVGWVGYAGNVGVGFALWLAAEKVMKNSAAANGIAVGTLIALILRALNDYTPIGQYTSQLGMGDYQMQSFVTPQILVDPLHSAEVQIPAGWAPVMLPPPAAVPAGKGTGVGDLYGTRGGGLY